MKHPRMPFGQVLMILLYGGCLVFPAIVVYIGLILDRFF